MTTIGTRRKTIEGARAEKDKAEKPKGFGTGPFVSVTVLAVLLAIGLVILLVLYFRRDSSLIKPENCPENTVSGTIALSDTKVSVATSNCGSNPTCVYTVDSLRAAEDICNDLGPVKCGAFSLEQIAASDDFTMTVSSSTATVENLNSDTYILA
jgi:hypothetical protein